jgi:membrane protease YdiL (CAAX protease family)
VETPGEEPRPAPPGKIGALLQILVCCGLPTQVVVAGTLRLAGVDPGELTRPAPAFIAALALGDAVLLLALIPLFLVAGGERPRDALLGARRSVGEVALGLLLLPIVFMGLLAVIATLSVVVPALHTVPINPFEVFFDTRLHAALFALVVIVAGGVREEVQRGFILHRFGQRLGGVWAGLAVWSLAFGAGHYTQGYDVAIGMTLAGAFWGWLYVRRRSVVAPMINHAAFDLTQVVKLVLMRGLAG